MISALLPVAAGAIQTAANVVTGAASAASTATSSAATAGSDFGAALTQAAGDAIKTMRTAETTSMAGIEGKVSVQQVVDGVMSAERTLQTTLAIRDKAVAAYQQISQMQI